MTLWRCWVLILGCWWRTAYGWSIFYSNWPVDWMIISGLYIYSWYLTMAKIVEILLRCRRLTPGFWWRTVQYMGDRYSTQFGLTGWRRYLFLSQKLLFTRIEIYLLYGGNRRCDAFLLTWFNTNRYLAWTRELLHNQSSINSLCGASLTENILCFTAE